MNFTTWHSRGIGIVRIIFGLLLVYHGKEVFDQQLMKEYMGWDTFQGSMAGFLVYCGKSAEFISGLLLTMGLFTRPAAVLVIGTFIYITFVVGSGKFWYEDQHPFMFALFGVLFFFTGAGDYSVDAARAKME